MAVTGLGGLASSAQAWCHPYHCGGYHCGYHYCGGYHYYGCGGGYWYYHNGCRFWRVVVLPPPCP